MVPGSYRRTSKARKGQSCGHFIWGCGIKSTSANDDSSPWPQPYSEAKIVLGMWLCSEPTWGPQETLTLPTFGVGIPQGKPALLQLSQASWLSSHDLIFSLDHSGSSLLLVILLAWGHGPCNLGHTLFLPHSCPTQDYLPESSPDTPALLIPQRKFSYSDGKTRKAKPMKMTNTQGKIRG